MARTLDIVDCPKCKNDLKVGALKCPTCGAEFTKAEADARSKEHWRNLGSGCLFLLFIAAALWWAFSSGDGKEAAEPQNKAAASVAGQSTPAMPDGYPVCTEAMESINAAVNRHDLRSAYTSAHKADLACSDGIMDAQPNIPPDCSDAVAQGHMFFGGLAETFDSGDIPFSKQDELASYRRTFQESVNKCNAILNSATNRK
jgi:hypothetical protein